MPFRQVRELLERIIAYHRRAGDFYAGLGAHAEKDAVRRVTEYLSGHEAVLAKSLEDFSSDAEHEINGAWIQNDPSYDMERVLEGLPIDRAEDPVEIVATAVEINRRLIKYFGRIADVAPNPRLEEIFRSLETQERKEQSRLAALREEIRAS